MSHFTNMKTRFQNLFYLEKALNRLEITHQREKKVIDGYGSNPYSINLVIPQSNGYDVEFCWNGQEYELVVDMSFWEQPISNRKVLLIKLLNSMQVKLLLGKVKKLDSNQLNINKIMMVQIH